jgi:hypothetical protein
VKNKQIQASGFIWLRQQYHDNLNKTRRRSSRRRTPSRPGQLRKRHSTVQGEFARLVKDDPRIDTELRAFLPRTYNLKAIADYQTGPEQIGKHNIFHTTTV